jgi:hypothetical protein
MFFPNIWGHIQNAANPYVFNDDVQQQIWPFLRYYDSELFQHDYIADYYLNLMPAGYYLLFRTSSFFLDPRVLSKALPYILLMVMLGAVGVSAWHLSGPASAWAAMALCLSSSIYLEQMCGGLPRAFGFPLIAVAIAGLILSRPYCLAVVSCLGAAFYYPVGVLVGLTLTLFLALPRRFGGLEQRWSWQRRIVFLAITGFVTILIASVSLVSLRSYGSNLDANDPAIVALYPEKGEHGRHPKTPRRDTSWRGLITGPKLWAIKGITARDNLWARPLWEFGNKHRGVITRMALVILLIGYLRLWIDQPAARRLLVLPVGVFLTSTLAVVMLPHLYYPARYYMYSMPLVLALALPCAVAAIPSYFRLKRLTTLVSSVTTVIVCLLILLLLGGRGSKNAGFTVNISETQKGLYTFLSTLPPDVLIAGWPDNKMSPVPYLTGRRVLATYETHVAFHEAYTQEMRRRLTSLIDAYFTSSPASLLRLREEFAVTHLVINPRHYNGNPATYFKPFDTMINQAMDRLKTVPIVLRCRDAASVYDQGDMFVLDLNNIPALK